jgi:hypothetical protein
LTQEAVKHDYVPIDIVLADPFRAEGRVPKALSHISDKAQKLREQAQAEQAKDEDLAGDLMLL